ncbi:AGC/PKA protein kinase, variant [Aphanomyces invadans]|uniref:non-specific serine/threonine protein kinase n=1 Tax=Aphanomyces invadans TaxID=157072 RepID=A0A024U839_9STRA|nr:AGC/PKA protein kinase, variant [Aphanomyces invadans]ETW02399.1 AGC/PKA protein kinase, variant [Aphanomyces invadans]|eukprot:XP_008869004.1 AGC/PKA protein kinase, variant [Aphanomyces invadans]
MRVLATTKTTLLLGELKHCFRTMCAYLGSLTHAVATAALLPGVVIHIVFLDPTSTDDSASPRLVAVAPPPDDIDLPPLKEEPLPPAATPLSRSCFDELTTLGAGLFGTVHLVRHKLSGQYFALKVIEKASIPSVQLARQVVRERDIMLAVQHPLVATCFGSFQDDENVYLVSEYLHGGDLYQHLLDTTDDATSPRVASLSVAAIRFYAANMVKALQGLHDHGMVHRDIKLDNMMFDSLGYVKLIDMGFATHVGMCRDNDASVGADKRTMTVCGTPEYMAPEILAGQGYGMAVDYWALGVVLYEMAMGGASLFGDASHAKTMARIKAVASHGLPTAPAFDKLDVALQNFIRGLLVYDPSKRLGCTASGFQSIEDHPFFAGMIDWKALMAKQVRAPFVPVVPCDTWHDSPPDECDENPIEDESTLWGVDKDEEYYDGGLSVDPKVALVFEGF